jgi:hypothetical protein
VRPERLGQLKNPVSSSGIEPPTFRLAAQCLKQTRYGVLACLRRRQFLRPHLGVFRVCFVCSMGRKSFASTLVKAFFLHPSPATFSFSLLSLFRVFICTHFVSSHLLCGQRSRHSDWLRDGRPRVRSSSTGRDTADSGAHPASYPIGTGTSFPGG